MTSYLFAWLVFLGLALGAMANVMIYNLTGGRWFIPVREPLLAGTRLVPVAALLGIPVIVFMHSIYPWTREAPGWWLSPGFFAGRSVAYLVLWSVLALLLRTRTRPGLSAAGLLFYGFSIALAAVDWIGSLLPRWSSSALGLIVGTGQALGAMALAVAFAGLAAYRGARDAQTREAFHDLGNLLMMYVLLWGYLAYMQYLVIWIGNLPREIAWYVPRLQSGWLVLGIALLALHFLAPLLVLLFRAAKRSPLVLGGLAATLAAAHVADVYWLVVPSVQPRAWRAGALDALALAVAAALWFFLWKPRRA